jgi:hypothetical protein
MQRSLLENTPGKGQAQPFLRSLTLCVRVSRGAAVVADQLGRHKFTCFPFFAIYLPIRRLSAKCEGRAGPLRDKSRVVGVVHG